MPGRPSKSCKRQGLPRCWLTLGLLWATRVIAWLLCWGQIDDCRKISKRLQSTCVGKGIPLLGKRRALRYVRALIFCLSLRGSSSLLVSCVSCRFFPRFFLGLVFCGFFSNFVLIGYDTTNVDCIFLRKIRRFPSNTRSKRARRSLTLPRFSRK